MTGEVVEFKRKEAPVSHATGTGKCLDCKHEWVAVIVSDNINAWLECPSCGLMRGRMYGNTCVFSEQHWTCSCGNDLFHITTDRTYCPNCGQDQVFQR